MYRLMAIIYRLQKLSSDVLKSNECLRSWGSGEGDDLRVRLFSFLFGVLSDRVSSRMYYLHLQHYLHIWQLHWLSLRHMNKLFEIT